MYYIFHQANRGFYKELVDACKASPVKCGVYSSIYQWSSLFGSSYVYGNDLPMWYAHYDGKPNFSDYKPYGGWVKPVAKQYSGSTSVCKMSVDLNYGPGI
jgi:hypothetical protein